ncbi:CHASE2 domain-containing protein [Mariprofundus erugo]|uniref:non-specific serine/threonine protein kinase n=1 Tax=Mariprofundus erugo TaxID=2528639 RepID=A0A5R9GIH1_9PROT|nr:serine/threonine-protein kinase [Mariprofundus erugo]TLS66516.1 CHASE2 domain-containing protein [Mariprofundus erugo]
MTAGAFWKTDWFLGIMITLLLLGAHSSGLQPLQELDNHFYDLNLRAHLAAVDEDIIIVDVDKASLAQMGNHPQSTIAETISKLSAAGAAVIALDLFYGQPDSDPAHGSGILPATLAQAGNILLPIYFLTGESGNRLNPDLPDYLNHATISHIVDTEGNQAINGGYLRSPYPELAGAAAGLGHLNIFPDADGAVRSEPLAVIYNGKYFPSMSLNLAARALHVPLSDIRINIGHTIELGPITIPVNERIQMRPAFHSPAYPVYSLASVWSGETPADLFNGKIVLIGKAGHVSGNTFATPLTPQMSSVEFNAHVLQSILKEEFISRPAWAGMVETGLMILIGLYLILLLPRMPAMIAAVASALLLLLIIGSSAFVLNSHALWLQCMSAALLLLTGHLALTLKLYGSTYLRSVSHQNHNMADTNKMLAITFQNQGMLEQAYEKFMACNLNDEIASMMYELALSFERKRQFTRAIDIYKHLSEHYQPGYRDIQNRLIAANSSREAVSDGDANAGLSSLLGSGDEKPTLGRYEILSELGKGAMGTVYLGQDPKINRKVAIKTMALSQEFEPGELEEVKKRFFHEAEIAGMLNHPNIVTIFDAGDEHDLAYIAMEYLDGVDLAPYTKKGKLLPLQTTLKIIARVAEALQYAHNHGVIHRDIKPANIMILKNKTVKVTDFGIAHITESSKTRDGVVLGTPSYMSPEQLSGKQLDGRSDLFSLGVMLYELTTGVRPFRAESIAKLMLKIAKEPHVDPRQHNPEIPVCVVTLIDRLLAKKAPQRVASASEALEEISHCLRLLNSSGGQS